MDQVFENCEIYNGLDSYVGKIGYNLKNQYMRLLEQH